LGLNNHLLEPHTGGEYTDLVMDDVSKKLKRAQGQVNAIVSMYEENRACLDIVQQIVAARSALSSVARDLLANAANGCINSRKDQKDFEKMLRTLVDLS